jgi:hypothetical protein
MALILLLLWNIQFLSLFSLTYIYFHNISFVINHGWNNASFSAHDKVKKKLRKKIEIIKQASVVQSIFILCSRIVFFLLLLKLFDIQYDACWKKICAHTKQKVLRIFIPARIKRENKISENQIQLWIKIKWCAVKCIIHASFKLYSPFFQYQ